jgi:hypothetical protein
MRSMRHVPKRQAQGPAHWTGNPPLSQLWLGSALGALAMLVLNAVCFLKMVFSRKARECHAEPAPRDLPDGTRGISNRETPQAAAAIDSRRAITHRTRHESCSGLTRASLSHAHKLEAAPGPRSRRRPGSRNQVWACPGLELQPARQGKAPDGHWIPALTLSLSKGAGNADLCPLPVRDDLSMGLMPI